ncbi:MAG: hypothetical protein N3H31_04090 [Candidatus Nezhaarchaeota archaeon]|nr:hypothetical protein [Candidatus Nezhaarchaeota archaeon]
MKALSLPMYLSEYVPPPVAGPAEATAAVLAISVFLIVSTGLGLWMVRKARSYDEWLVGHRDIGPIITAFALVATWLSGWAIFGNAGLGYTFGWAGAWLIGIMNIMGISLCLTLGYRMRRYAALGARSVPEVLRLRFDSRTCQAVAGLIMLLLMILYAVGQFKAMATVWRVYIGVGWIESLVAVAILVFIYMAVGGYAGTTWALGFQGITLTVISWMIGIATLSKISPGYIEASLAGQKFVAVGLRETPHSIGGYVLPIAPGFPGYDLIGITAVLFMFLFMATGFPHNIARFLGVRKVTKREMWIMVIVVIIGSLSPLWVGAMGLAGRAVWGPVLMGHDYKPMYGDAAGALMPIYAAGPVGAGLFAAAVFAAAVSTLAALIMIASINVTRDLIHNFKPQASPRTLLWLSRLLLPPFLFIPLYWNVEAPPPVLAEFMAGVAVGQAGIYFFSVAVSMYWKRATKIGALASMIYGFIITPLHPAAYGRLVGLTHWGYWTLLLIFGCAAVYFLVSLATKPLPEDKLAKLFPAKPSS